MKKHNKIIALFTVLALVMAIGVVGCQVRNEKPNPPNNTNNGMGDNDNLNNGNMNNNNNTNMGNNDTDMEINDRAERIADAVADLNDVRRATVVISGNTAIVGVSMVNTADGNVTNNIKENIRDTVRRVDNRIDNVSVTANPDLYQRIENIANDIGEGRPLSGFGTEIEELLRRIAPTM